MINILVAYPYVSPAIVSIIKDYEKDVRWVVDSGAFTAWRSGNEITLDSYCNFLESLPIRPWRYFALDKIGDPHGTKENFLEMKRRGFDPIPIFTRGEDTRELEEYYAQSDVVGIDGLVGTKNNKGFVKGIMNKVGDRKVHWLGFTSLPFVKHYKPYMCDSSSWEAGARFGAFKLYMGDAKSVMLKRTDFVKPPNAVVTKRLEYFGFKASDFAKEESWHGGVSPNRRLNAASGVQLSLDIEKNLKTKMFLAATTDLAVRMICEAHTLIKGKT